MLRTQKLQLAFADGNKGDFHIAVSRSNAFLKLEPNTLV